MPISSGQATDAEAQLRVQHIQKSAQNCYVQEAHEFLTPMPAEKASAVFAFSRNFPGGFLAKSYIKTSRCFLPISCHRRRRALSIGLDTEGNVAVVLGDVPLQNV